MKATELEWLKEKKEYLSIDKIERDIACPKTTIHLFVNGHRDLPEKWKKPLVEWVKRFKR
jgi:hypothetical protein